MENESTALALAQQLLEQMKQMQASFADAFSRQSDEIKALRDEVETLRSRSSTPVPTPAVTLSPPPESRGQPDDAPTTASKPPNYTDRSDRAGCAECSGHSARSGRAERSERLPDIPEFSGKRSQLALWKASLTNKLTGNRDRYPTENSQLTYARSRITGEPALTLSRLNNDFTTLESLISWLDNQYGDPNEKTNAELKLRELRQGKRAFWKFFTEFRTLASKAGTEEKAQYMLLKGAINPDLQRFMIGRAEPDSLTDFVNIIAKIDEQLRFIDHPSRSTQQRLSHRTDHQDPDAMDLDTVEQRHEGTYAPLGSKERARRLEKNLCFKCGKPGHISPNCKKPYRRNSSVEQHPREVNAVDRSPSLSRRRSRRRSNASASSSSSDTTTSPRRSKGRSRN
jgi:hypothetical protein